MHRHNPDQLRAARYARLRSFRGDVPGVKNVHRDLCLGEKFRRSRDRAVWSDSVVVRVELADA
jgi:hypothetical protein